MINSTIQQAAAAHNEGKFDEAEVRKNFALIYVLLDEVMDYGYP